MSNVCQLDGDDCLSISSILEAFHCGIKEEQAWALIYQSIISLDEYITRGNKCLVKPRDLLITSDGVIHPKSWRTTDNRENYSFRELVSLIAKFVYKALDYGTPEDEELVLSSQLESVFEYMTYETEDEGIGAEEFCSYKLLNKCESRITDHSITDIGQHYRHVCRALVAEALELTTFLKQVSIGNQELKKINDKNSKEVDIKIEVWAHLWMRVMRELRLGVALKSIDKTEIINRQQKEYELTPFELLLDDINSKRYDLKKVEPLPTNVVKDARNVILDHIRSRPPLRPASERQLSPLPNTEPSLHQKLMEGIKSPHNLRPTKPFERKFNSVHLPRGKRFSIYTKSVVIEPPEDSVFQRLSFRNMSLRPTKYDKKSEKKSSLEGSDVIDGKLSSTQEWSGVSFWRRFFRW